ncbi:MAG: MoxR family ATPase [Lachnoclostridium sp.]|nr:MoxR family ATPase [Lachnospira sp.]MCM1247011.1 MoxR family ATPase [Lachnoclostridium sp.]
MVAKILDNISKVMVGKDDVSKLLLTAMLAGGHVLIEDVPGVGKTTVANALARTVDCKFTRIQFTPDTMPSDITGSSIYNYEKHLFEYVEGAIMSNIILADEINRTSPKTQASLLEAMEEGRVTVDGKTYELPRPFMVIATQNPIMQRGTYYLPESQLDRFMMKINMGYPEKAQEVQIVKNMIAGVEVSQIQKIINVDELSQLKSKSQEVLINDRLIEYAAECVDRTRKDERVQLGASPRALLAWVRAAKAYAFVEGREYVTPDDLKFLSSYVLAHRLTLAQHSSKETNRETDIIKEVMRKVKVPVGK